MNNLSFHVKPNENGPWELTAQNGASTEVINVDYQSIVTGNPINLYYELAHDSQWVFAENGAYFSDAKDNFNYQLNSIVANNNKSLIISISSIVPNQALSSELSKLLTDNPNKAISGKLDNEANYEINFRLIAKKQNCDNYNMRYFSQDPRVIIQDMEPTFTL